MGYGYGNARLRARRSQFLGEGDYQILLAQSGIASFITRLSETRYEAALKTALALGSGLRQVEEALTLDLTQELRQVRSFYDGEAGALIDLLFRRWDRHNLIALLRGQRQGGSAEQMMLALIPVGQLDETALRELARQPGLRAMIDLMTVWQLPYARALRRIRARSGTLPDLDQLELGLNRFHYADLRAALTNRNGNRAIVRAYVNTEIDLLNLRVSLRLAWQRELVLLVQQRYAAPDSRPLLIEPGGELAVGRLVALIDQGTGPEGVIQGLRDSRYGPALAEGWARYQAGDGNLATIERALEYWQADYLTGMFSHKPLSIAIPIGYIGCKEIEVANLRLIAQAIALKMPAEQIWSQLIVLRS